MAKDDVAPLRMEVRFRNNLILRKMGEAGIETVAELCRKAQERDIDLKQMQVGELINMKELPIRKDGTWRTVAQNLALFFNCIPEHLFSEEQLETKLKTNRGHAELTFGQVHALLASVEAERLLPEAAAEQAEMGRLLEEMLGILPERLEKVVRLRFGIGVEEHTLEEVAAVFDLTRERVRQMEGRALRILRHPRHADYLGQYIDPPEEVDKRNGRVVQERKSCETHRANLRALNAELAKRYGKR